MEIYIDKKVSNKKVLDFIKDQLENRKTELHSFQLYEGDRLLLKIGIPPYSNDDFGQIYSLSKSFASTAIGILWDRGLLNVNEKVIDIFKDKAPVDPSDNLKKMTVHHLLSMNTGHSECVMPYIANAADGVTEFLKQDVKYEPGAHFTYNTGATYMLSAIVTKITGQTLYDFLKETLWKPLGITPTQWQTCADGITEGGIGLFASTELAVRLGKLYLNKGVFNGKRIISEEWVELAQKPHSDNSANGTHDWTAGYGYQFWRCAKEGYRGDGAFGQYCIILPDKNLTFALKTETNDMQGSLDGIFEFLYDYEGDDESDIENEISEIYKPSPSEKLVFNERTYRLESNLQGFTAITPYYENGNLVLEISNGVKMQKISAGNGEMIYNKIIAKSFKPILLGLAPYLREEECEFYASYSVCKNEIKIDMRYTNCPHHCGITLNFDDDKFMMKLNVREYTVYDSGLVIKGC